MKMKRRGLDATLTAIRAFGTVPLESKIERDHVKRVKKAGGLSLKFKSPSVKGVPDRLDLYGLTEAYEAMGCGCAECQRKVRAIIAAAIQFTETKAPGKKPRADQKRFHARLRKLGFQVNVVDE